MKTKTYQENALKSVDAYLDSFMELCTQAENEALPEAVRAIIDPPKQAYEAVKPKWIEKAYQSKATGDGQPLPNFCLKIPTGGGKTYLAVETISRVFSRVLRRRTGLVLWVVPSTQIYDQTIGYMRDRTHAYRQLLDVFSGGRTMVVEKGDRFTPQDIDTRLVILMLMLPSANRQNKETLKMFQDAGGFESFFPPETNLPAHEELLRRVPNLDVFGGDGEFFGRQVKTSLGNVLRILRPVLILDEGQKAYSDGAQATIRGFNPSMLVELSATPPSGSNVLIDIPGRDLDSEGMIKLDLHVRSEGVAWQDTLHLGVQQRNVLEMVANEYRQKTGVYIRPINLIQVERTGKDQRGQGHVHALDVKEHLERVHHIPSEQIAIKTSDQNDIEKINLLSSDCEIRYIITKSALQEGWDCPFAYVLTVLTNPTSRTGLTQLVGRILRQPYAEKTGVRALDESYVYCYQSRADALLQVIKQGLEGEGLGDLTHAITPNYGTDGADTPRVVHIRERFQQYDGKVFLPKFYVESKGRIEELDYETHLLSRLNWNDVSLSPSFEALVLRDSERVSLEAQFGFKSGSLAGEVGDVQRIDGVYDPLFVARRIGDLVPNPWVAKGFADQVHMLLRDRYDESIIAGNVVFVISELRKVIEAERDRLTQAIFESAVQSGEIRLLLYEGMAYQLPKSIEVRMHTTPLRNRYNDGIQSNLFDEPVPEEAFNDLEKQVAWYMEDHEHLLWWYRNIAKKNYYVQGWRKSRIYADFIAAKAESKTASDYTSIYVLETKGNHLKNPDTKYKAQVFEKLNELADKMEWAGLGMLSDKKIRYHVVYEDEWQRVLNALLDDSKA